MCRVTLRDDTDNPPQGTERLFEEDDPRGVNPEHADTLRNILATIHAALNLAHLNQPGLRLHPLKGQRKGFGLLPYTPTGG
jgi:proteic killer suppression protein